MAILKKRISSKSGARITNTGIKFSNAISVKSAKKRKFDFDEKSKSLAIKAEQQNQRFQKDLSNCFGNKKLNKQFEKSKNRTIVDKEKLENRDQIGKRNFGGNFVLS